MIKLTVTPEGFAIDDSTFNPRLREEVASLEESHERFLEATDMQVRDYPSKGSRPAVRNSRPPSGGHQGEGFDVQPWS